MRNDPLIAQLLPLASPVPLMRKGPRAFQRYIKGKPHIPHQNRRTLTTHPPGPISVDSAQIASLASKPLHPLTLADLVRHGRPPLTAEQLFASANFALSLIPSRLAHRLHAIRNLPFIVVSNPHIACIYNNYAHSLSTLLPYKEKTITNLEDEKQFTEVMADLVQTHSNTIPILARGFLECRKYISGAEVTAFLDEHLRQRIGTRLIAEQHIALHLSSLPHSPPPSTLESQHEIPSSTRIGVIDTACRPADIIHQCEATVGEICELKYGVRPQVIVKGEPTTSLAQVPTHLEYILTELLKNAFRATIETNSECHPIEVTIAASSPSSCSQHVPTVPPAALPHDRKMTDHSSVPALTIRICDRGGGIPPTALPNIWAYSFTTFNEEYDIPFPSFPSPGSTASTNAASSSTSPGTSSDIALSTLSASAMPGSAYSLAGLGYGLPLGRAYAEHFGGRLSVQSLWGWGTDVYLGLQGLMNVEG